MRIIKTKNYEDLSRVAGAIMASQVRMKPNSVLGLATGSTPIGMYQELARAYRETYLDFSKVTTFNLDEYVGMEDSNTQSYHYFMYENLFKHINIKKENTHILNGVAHDFAKEASDFDKIIDDMGGIDMQLLGMGKNSHIGFNEPSDTFIAATHLVKLDDSTIEANSRFFESKEEVPTSALTLGFRHIMQAKKILFIVSGREKADILQKALEGDVHPGIPASILQLHHDVTVVGDAEALSWYKD